MKMGGEENMLIIGVIQLYQPTQMASGEKEKVMFCALTTLHQAKGP